ncbi:DUF4350 domain-containing protein [Cellulomonas sp. APG4]|uniref:DUF4350 domain-containing protein n=1 Tax=Cellulomonas sp. APG4 TaxID=1538656 RepID=UPI00137AE88F|nr:DUF4350 domain-containing protein [Cellulomonas sp. APG4]NCT91361.1 DUF4350 domain-containing protein [Cellulomonas sp. APG4]
MTAPPAPSPLRPSAPTRSTVSATSTVMGDGTTASSRARRRWRRAVVPLVVVALLALAALLAAVLRPATSGTPLAPDNPEPNGGRALAQVLERQGVTVEHVRTSAEVARAAEPGTTLLVTSTFFLLPDQVDVLADTGADLVLAEPDWTALDSLTDGALDTGWADSTSTTVLAPECADPDARAAEGIDSDGSGLTSYGDATMCFPHPEADTFGERQYAYAVWDDDARRITAIDDATLLTNARLADEGHAALALRALGRNDHLVWYVPAFEDTGVEGGGVQPTGSLLPSWAGPVGAQLVVVVLVLAVWRGRRLGPVVTEPLPVTVRAAEATVGRGRLYRRSRSRGHAAAALRAGTARRAAARLGLPRSAGAPEVLEALARATGRDTAQVADLLYGPPPTDDAGLVDLTRRLDELESEVHRT